MFSTLLARCNRPSDKKSKRTRKRLQLLSTDSSVVINIEESDGSTRTVRVQATHWASLLQNFVQIP